jgi:hypothetical protein
MEIRMSFSKVANDITCYKPKMRQAKRLYDVPLNFEHQKNITWQVKADGEFNFVKYSREGLTYLLNRFGRQTTGLPCLNELMSLMQKWNIVEAEMLAELYAVDENERPLTLPNLVHFLKGKYHGGPECKGKSCYGKTVAQMHNQIRLGFFDILSVNGVKSTLIYPVKFATMMGWFEDGRLMHVLPWGEPSKWESVDNAWVEKVEGEHWEGLIIRNGDTYKVKPNCDVDVAIIGVNKNNKGFDQGRATSLKMGLMNDDDNFVEIGDCAGIGETESLELFELVKSFKIGEDATTVFVQPVVVMTVEYIETYPDTRNKVFQMGQALFKELGEQTLVRLRNPHVKGYRADKKICVEDIGLNQVG